LREQFLELTDGNQNQIKKLIHETITINRITENLDEQSEQSFNFYATLFSYRSLL
jgi:hypothetical protein